jgi:hypothetical protein
LVREVSDEKQYFPTIISAHNPDGALFTASLPTVGHLLSSDMSESAFNQSCRQGKRFQRESKRLAAPVFCIDSRTARGIATLIRSIGHDIAPALRAKAAQVAVCGTRKGRRRLFAR